MEIKLLQETLASIKSIPTTVDNILNSLDGLFKGMKEMIAERD